MTELRRQGPVPSWGTITYLAAVECETCRWFDGRDAADVAGGRRAARKHARQNPGHRVRVEVGKTTVYGQDRP